MKISKLIQQLEIVLARHGDNHVVIPGIEEFGFNDLERVEVARLVNTHGMGPSGRYERARSKRGDEGRVIAAVVLNS
jgi:hypothetical protein